MLSTEPAPDQRRDRFVLDLAQHAVLLLGIVLRPFIFGGELGAPDQLVWHGLVLVGWLLCLVEWWSGQRSGWRWAPAGLAAAALLLVLLPAAWRAAEPILGWGRWASWASLLLWAGYLMQALPGRTRFAWSLLVGCLAVEVVLGLVQAQHVLPAMAAAIGSGEQGMGELVARVGSEDVADRIARGGVYGSFTLANILAAWLILVGTPLAGAVLVGVRAWRRRLEAPPPSDALVLGCLLLGLTLATLLASGARGAPLALAAAASLVALRWWRSRWRALPLLALGGLGIVALLLPELRTAVQGSIDVRLGYWRAALALLGEHGLFGSGIGGFEAHAAAFLRPQDEFSRYAHNELIEAAVAGGVLAAGAMLAWWIRHLWSRPAIEEPTPTPAAGYAGWLRWLPLLVFPYMLLFGTFASDNLAWWPGGEGAAIVLWAALLGGLFGWVASVAARLPLPPAWAVHLALASGVLACLLDFPLHDLSYAGSLVTVACLAGVARARELRVGTGLRLAATVLVALAGLALAQASRRSAELRQVDTVIRLLDGQARAAATGDREQIWAHLHDLALEASLPPPPAGSLPDSRQRGTILLAAWQIAADALQGWPADPDRRIQLALRHPDPAARYPLLAEAVTAQTHDPEAWSLLARAALDQRRWNEAIAAARNAVARYPAQLRHRLLLAQILEAAAEHDHGDPAALRAEAVALRTQVAELDGRAHPRHRVGVPIPAPAVRRPPPESGPPAR